MPNSSKSHPHSNNAPVLNRILRDAETHLQRNESFLTVFDLDSTLFDLTLRTSRIVDTFLESAEKSPEMMAQFSSECAALKNLQIWRTDWGMSEGLARIGITENSHSAFWHELHRFWAHAFFSNEFLHHDIPLEGAVKFVHELRARGAHVMYLTGRDTARMKAGTEKSLIETGFPIDEPGIQLVLKPLAKMDDAKFKVDVLKEATHRYRKIWLFENEPVNLNLVAQECPHIGLVFIESTHSGREVVSDQLDRIVHFEMNLDEFEKK